jgi:hypothetical protein
MPHARHTLIALLFLCGIAGGRPAIAAEPVFTLSEDGGTFLYRARPGDLPSTVAEMFGIPPQDVPAFLAANGIKDPTRVGTGFVYRIPNAAARALAERKTALEQDNARLGRALADEKERTKTLGRTADEAKAAATDAQERAAHLARMETFWPWLQAALVVLVLVAAGAAYTAFAAMRRQGQSEVYARTLAKDVEEKRKVALADRQESARRILDLENRLRTVEAQLRPRVVVSGRGNS